MFFCGLFVVAGVAFCFYGFGFLLSRVFWLLLLLCGRHRCVYFFSACACIFFFFWFWILFSCGLFCALFCVLCVCLFRLVYLSFV